MAAVAAALLTGSGGRAAASAQRATIPAFAHVIVVVFENHERSSLAGAPTFSALARRYASLTRYTAVAHPSLPNYLALVSGSTQGIAEDCTTCVATGRSLADTLLAAGRSWKTYAEGLPAPGWTGSTAGGYVKKHDPFLYFRTVLERRSQLRRVVPLAELDGDVRHGRLPDFSLVVPDLCHDMHDCPVRAGDTWLRRRIVPLLARTALRRSVVFVVFDEGTSDTGGGGNVLALALGPLVRRGVASTAPTNHLGLLRTIEDAWHLPRLGGSAEVRPITGIWRSR